MLAHAATSRPRSPRPGGKSAAYTLSCRFFRIVPTRPRPTLKTDRMPQTERILVVDDERQVAAVLTETLRKGGYEAEAACSGQTALAMLEDSPFAVLLLDVIMPGMGGLQVLAEVTKRYPNVVVVMTTAVRSPDTIVQAMKLGAVDYIIKPFERDKVLLSVSSALETRRAKLELQDHQRLLVEHVKRGSHSLKQKAREIQSLLLGVIESLAYTIEAKDKWI